MREQNRIFISQVFEMEDQMVGGDLELCGFQGNMSISKHSADLETTRFPWKPRDFQKIYASSRAGLRFPIGIHPSSYVRVETVHFSHGNHMVSGSMEISSS